MKKVGFSEIWWRLFFKMSSSKTGSDARKEIRVRNFWMFPNNFLGMLSFILIRYKNILPICFHCLKYYLPFKIRSLDPFFSLFYLYSQDSKLRKNDFTIKIIHFSPKQFLKDVIYYTPKHNMQCAWSVQIANN